jgi:hypothetical protein
MLCLAHPAPWRLMAHKETIQYRWKTKKSASLREADSILYKA